MIFIYNLFYLKLIEKEIWGKMWPKKLSSIKVLWDFLLRSSPAHTRGQHDSSFLHCDYFGLTSVYAWISLADFYSRDLISCTLISPQSPALHTAKRKEHSILTKYMPFSDKAGRPSNEARAGEIEEDHVPNRTDPAATFPDYSTSNAVMVATLIYEG